jgi:hypothetical protein
MAQLTIQDVYTTGDGVRKWVFNPGDGIQFNIDHSFDNALPMGTLCRVTWITERYEQVTADNGGNIGFRFIVRRGFHSDNPYNGGGFYTTWFNFVLDQLPDPLNLQLDDRAAFFQFIEQDWVFLSFPGYWRLTGIVELTDPATNHEIMARGEAHYRING